MKRLRLIWFILILFLLNSCSPSSVPASPTPNPTAGHADMSTASTPLHFPADGAMGGYVENDVTDFYTDRYLANNYSQNDCYYAISDDYQVWQTDITQKQWTRVDGFDWLGESEEIAPYYLSSYIITQDHQFIGLIPKTLRTGEVKGNSKLIMGDADGYTILTDNGDWEFALFDMEKHRCLLFGEEGDSVFYDYQGKQVLSTVGENDYLSSIYSNHGCVIIDDILYAINHHGEVIIYPYELPSLEPLDPISYGRELASPLSLAFCALNDTPGFLYACPQGIYYLSTSGEYQLLIPGKDTYMARPSVFLSHLYYLSNGNILLDGSVLDGNGLPNYGISSYLYTYDPNKDNTPAADPLTIFSLDENKTLLEAISIAQQDGMAIDFSIGTDGGVLPDDAIRSLLTQLLAGSGPDVIALDGLPLSQLASKGALLDLQTLLPSGCLDNITASFRQEDGAVFTIPARFFLPTLLGKDISNVSGLPALASWTQSHPYQDLGIGPPRLLPQFFPLYAHSWIVDGKLQEDAFRKDLEALGQLGRMWLDTTVKDHRYLENDPSFLVYQWFSDTQAGAFGYYDSVQSLVQPYSALQQKEGQFLPFGDGVFLPACMMGINAASPKQEQAQAFLSTLFSDKVQGADLQDGFPVLLSSLQAQMDQFEPGTDMGAMEITWNEPYAEAMTMKLNWPAKEDFASLLESMKQLTKAGETDRALQDLLTEETLSYIRGEQSLDQCLQALKSKLDIYLAE